jgi:uncharacterized protein YbbC (DUF1343 family)
MEDNRKWVKIIEKFLKFKKYDFVCGYFIDVVDDEIGVVVHISDEVLYQKAERDILIVKRIKDQVKKDVKTYIGIDVFVGNNIIKCF